VSGKTNFIIHYSFFYSFLGKRGGGTYEKDIGPKTKLPFFMVMGNYFLPLCNKL